MKDNSLYDIEYFQKMKIAHQNKKKRLRRRRIIILCLIVLVVLYIVLPISKISSVQIKGNKIYSNQKIEEIANIQPNMFSLLHPSFAIKNNLEKSNLFTNVEVSKSLMGNVIINVQENNILFYNKKDNKFIFYDNKGNKLTFDKKEEEYLKSSVTELIGDFNDDLKTKMVSKLSELDESVLQAISQIKHYPQKYDQEYFKFIMSGKKKVYIYTSLDDIVSVGVNYHNFAANSNYDCTIIEYINSENRAIVKKC